MRAPNDPADALSVGNELVPGITYQDFVQEALLHRTEAEFRASPFFQTVGAPLAALLSTPRIEEAAVAGNPEGEVQSDVLRVVHWNIEKGKGLRGLIHFLTTDPFLRAAHIYTLNEADSGTARSGNVDVVRALAHALGCHSVYLPSYIECTKGLDDDLLAPGENALGLHGLAVLSRLPIREARMAPLPHCHDYFRSPEKRFGLRQGLYLRLEWQGRPLIVATTHLEVRRTPACRARQFRIFLQGLEAARDVWGRDHPVVLTGDWNTNTFQRGSVHDSLFEFLRIVFTGKGRLADQLLHPRSREPLFALLDAAGYEVDPFNDATPTASQDLGTVEDLRLLPRWLGKALLKTFGLPGRVLQMRLDWIAARGLKVAGSPRTLAGFRWEHRRVSDHAVIGADLCRSAR